MNWPSTLRLEAAPFLHAIVDDLLSPDEFADLQRAFVGEPRLHAESEIYSQERSTSPPLQPALRAFCDALGERCALLGEQFGVTLKQVDGAAYLYRPGDYLLAHSDCGDGRALAYAYYLSPPGRGGALLLFECTLREKEIVRTRPARRIRPRANRLVLFTVSETALHCISEVTAGERASIAGWFYP